MNKSSLVVILGAAVLSISPFARAEEPSVEERLQRIEKAIARIESRLNETVSSDELAPTLKEFSDLTRSLGWDGKSPITAVKPAGKEKSLAVGGFVQLQGEAGDAPDFRFNGINDRFLIRRARLNIKGTFAEGFDFALQSEFGNNSISGVSGYRLQATDVFINWNKYEKANITMGQFKTPFGYEQLLSDTKVLFVERSLPNDQLTFGRQAGVAASGTFADKRLTYSAGIFNGNSSNNGANDNEQFFYVGRVGVVAWSSKEGKLSFAVDGAKMRENSATLNGHRTAWSTDGQFTYGPFDFAAEYFHHDLDRLAGTDIAMDGWYAQAAYFLPGRKWQLLGRYETFNANKDIAGNESSTWSAGVSYYLKGDDLKFSLNYLLGDPAGPLKDQGRLLGRVQLVY
jgi:phosphate-selective porin